MRDKIQNIVAENHAGKHSVGIIDETSFVKKGTKTSGVNTTAPSANGRIALSPFISLTRKTTFTRLSIRTCLCPNHGMPTANVVGRQAFRTPLFIVRNDRSPLSNMIARQTTGSNSSG